MEWAEIRRRARACHVQAIAESKGDRRAAECVRAALNKADLQIQPFEPGTSFGEGVLGVLERADGLVHVASTLSPESQAQVLAHELGHFHLHLDPRSEITLANPGLAGDPIATGVAKVEGYSQRERKEVQADVFAGEFLCPSDWTREEIVVRGKTPSQVAAELGVPASLALHQAIRALLLPPLRELDKTKKELTPDLDTTQKSAATWAGGPLLVDAGPGTGKTRTLIRRISHLLDQGVPPSAILALTFSNRAAQEMRERLAAAHPQGSIEIWVGTFHAFGLELVTKWPGTIGRTSKVRVLDESDSLALLEEHLAELPLRHFQNLYEPAYELVNVLRAISRCKDELITPEAYLKEAEAALRAASTEEEKERAEKAEEAGRIYRVYEAALKESDAVDFGDLILHATSLIEQNAEVQKYVGGFQHVLVDEYQDVNFASSQLLKAIRGRGANVWVVADQRQSIYRFRGAEPSNVSRFVAEFSGTSISLGSNYRSVAPVVEVFQTFSSAMGAGSMGGTWTPYRGAGPKVTLTVAANVRAEAEAIRRRIELLRKQGVPYADQVILARSHLTLARVTSVLEELGVPLLYLGDLFERDDVRDLLSLVSIGAEPGGVGLARVLPLPLYGGTRDDASKVIAWARTQHVHPFAALLRAEEVPEMTAAGKSGAVRLGTELQGLENASAWTLLTTWLFERSGYLKEIVRTPGIRSQQQLIAIYHLLKFCSEQASTGNNSRKALLERVRRLEALNQDTVFRAIASEASDIDAVRVMTIHGSKGLEFLAVHLPALATRYMPSGRQPVRCPPPVGLPQLAMDGEDHDAEEECLFFVALSRARDHLSLSRAEKYTTQNAGASKFVERLPRSIETAQHRGTGPAFSLPVLKGPAVNRPEYSERELDLYMRCPALYRYEMIDGLRGTRDSSAYLAFHRCVYTTVEWLEKERGGGRSPTQDAAAARLMEEWKSEGPVEHPFERYYRGLAHDMVLRMLSAMATESGEYAHAEWTVTVGARKITVTPDRVLRSASGLVTVQRIRTGKQTKSELTKPVYALLRAGARAQHPGKPVQVETFYLSSGNRVVIDGAADQKRLQEYLDAISGIESGDCRPDPEARKCPNCPAYFACRA
jgi:DNA helicase-2/ATP-dependent DNA helicase PcrA